MEKLREEIERTWWEIDTQTEAARNMMPTPKEHRNLLGDKEKYLEPILSLIRQHLEPPLKPDGMTYTLVCENCKEIFYSSEAFPSPQLCPVCKLPEDRVEAVKEIAEIVLEIRQYLCNTEFAPEPFTRPVDMNVLKVEFPAKIIGICQLLF